MREPTVIQFVANHPNDKLLARLLEAAVSSCARQPSCGCLLGCLRVTYLRRRHLCPPALVQLFAQPLNHGRVLWPVG